jgi:hypothetical protein
MNLVAPNAPPEAFGRCGKCGAVHDDAAVVNMLQQAVGQGTGQWPAQTR